VDPSGLATRKGHHYVPVESWEERGFQPSVVRIFDRARTGKIPGGHGWTKLHKKYNRVVQKLLDEYMTRRGVTPATMTDAQAEAFVQAIKKSRHPVITKFLEEYVTHRYRLDAKLKAAARAASKRIRLSGVSRGLKCLGVIGMVLEFVLGREAERREYEEYWSDPRNVREYFGDPDGWHRRNPMSFYGPPM
jgi:hypothetical protein